MVAPRGSSGFGGRLREARERRGVTLRQIANATKISISALEALERNDLSRLPGGIFSRAFVRSYALEVGLDPEQAIQEFIAQFPGDSVTAGRPGSDQIEDNVAVESDRQMASTVLRLVAMSIPIAGVLLYLMANRARDQSASPQPAPAATAGTSTRVSDAAPARAGDAPVESASGIGRTAEVSPPAPAAPAVPSDHIVVGFSPTGPCWVAAVADGKRVISRDLQAGEQQSVDGRELVLTLGSAGAMNLTINGQPAKPLGRPGQVVTVRINAGNF